MSEDDPLGKLITKVSKLTFRVPDRHEFLHHSYKGAHTSYFFFVFLEGHGLYAMAGGALFLFSVLDFFLHFEG